MSKDECVERLKYCLKKLGYIKKRNYWYKKENDILHCICVLGSRWNENDYYIEIGISKASIDDEYPTIGDWDLRSPCLNDRGQNQNPELLVVFKVLEKLEKIHDYEGMVSFLSSQQYVKLGKQFSIL